MRKSKFISLVAIFAALNVVCDSFMGIPQFTEGVWYSWIFIIESLNGIILGPFAGFLSTFIGVMIGHFIYFRGAPEFLFTLGAPIGAMISGLLFRGKWRAVFAYYTILFAAYFITPVSWQLPIWGMWDTYCAYAALLVLYLARNRESIKIRIEKGFFILPLCTLIGLEADVLFRIFLFIPCQTYQTIYGFNIEALQLIWIMAALTTPIQVALSTIITWIDGTPLIKILRKRDILQ